jgi:hypothetical protein
LLGPLRPEPDDEAGLATSRLPLLLGERRLLEALEPAAVLGERVIPRPLHVAL